MSFVQQVKALVVKDFQVAKRNKVATGFEIIVPIFMACMSGLFVLLLTNISSNGDEWSYTNKLNFGVNDSFYSSVSGSPGSMNDYFNRVNNTLVQLNHSFINCSDPTFNTTIAAYENHSTGFSLDTLSGGPNRLKIASASLGEKSMESASMYGTLLGALLVRSNFVIDKESQDYITASFRTLGLDINLRAIFASTSMLLILYAFIPSSLVNGGRLVAEKKNKIREVLRVMGVDDSAYLFAHCISIFLRMFVGCLLIAFILTGFGAIDGSDIPLVLGICVLFCFAMICEAMMMPALFSVDVWTNVFNIFFVMGAASLSQFNTGSSKGVQLVICLLAPSAFYFSLLPTLCKGSMTLQLTAGEGCIMLIVDMVLYFMIASYVYNVAPGEFGVAKHPLYFISWIWEKKKEGGESSSKYASSSSSSPAPAVIASNSSPARHANDNTNANTNILSPANADVDRNSDESMSPVNEGSANGYAIYVKNITKVYPGNTKPSVDKMNLMVKKGTCAGLNGHNGSGKTTTISMLTGVLDSTSYDVALVNGKDIRTEMDLVRQDLGLCPQFDVIFEDLTAIQSITLFARMKGMSDDDPRIFELMKDLNLPDDENPCKVYSGGTKRRLSLANALVGKPSLVFLDEPSSGLDPISRRQMWNVIKKEKKRGTTILLTTHFMEEADALSDKITIMSLGKEQVCASSSELKHRYDVGYTLSTVKAAGADSTLILQLLQKHVPNASLKLDSEGEAQFLVKSENLTPMLVELEANQSQLKIQSYGIDACTLEDVFIRLASEQEHLEEGAGDGTGSPLDAGSPIYTPQDEDTFERKFATALQESEASRIWFQTKMTLLRCFRMLSRSTPIKVFAIFFPIFLMLIGFATLQPNQSSKGNVFKIYDWVDLKKESLNLVMLNLRNTDTNDRLRSEVQRVFSERVSASEKLNWYVAKSYSDFSTGQYVPLSGFTFTGPKSPPVHGGVIPHDYYHLGDSTRATANYTFMWNPKYDPVIGATMAAVMRIAVENILGRNNTQPPNSAELKFEPVRLDYPAIVARAIMTGVLPNPMTQNTSHDGKNGKKKFEEGGDDGGKTYNVMVLGIYFVISVGQLVTACYNRGFAEELSKKIYRVLLLNGLHPLAHLIGNVIFGFICSFWALIILIVGFYIKGIDSITEGGVIGPVFFAALLFVIHVCLYTLVYMAYSPGKTPVSYTVAIHGANLVMLGAPYLVDVLFRAAHVSFREDVRPILLALCPPCAFYHVMDVAASVKPNQAQASRLFSFGTDEITDNAKTGYCFLFLGLELLVPLALLHNFVYNCGIYAYVNRNKDGDIQGNVNLRDSMGEKQHLLTSQEQATAATSATRGSGSGGSGAFHQVDSSSSINFEALEDEDVKTERARTSRQPSQLTLDHVRKCFNNGEKIAVRNLSLGVEEGECLGVAGPNAAGKSTTFNMIVRELLPTSGAIEYMKGSVSATQTPVLNCYRDVRMGITMQDNTHWDFLTAREHIEFYMQLRLLDQYQQEEWADYIDRWIKAVELHDVETTHAGGYSGGMKRKLMAALTFSNGSKLCLLDEISTGVDPAARRALWKIIKRAAKTSCTIVCTSHSMEEIDAISSRICIMTNGVMRCIGTSQHLKSKYGANFVVAIDLQDDDDDETFSTEENLARHVEHIQIQLGSMFESAQLLEHVGTLCRFQVSHIDSIAQAFQQLDDKKKDWKMRSFNVSQMASLEQIFMNFVKSGKGGKDIEAEEPV